MDNADKAPFDTQLSLRFQSVIWSCLDAELTRTAVFYAERFYIASGGSHVSRHLCALALLKEGQTYSALHYVNIEAGQQCSGCLELKAKCCTALGRFRQASEALEASMAHPTYGTSCA